MSKTSKNIKKLTDDIDYICKYLNEISLLKEYRGYAITKNRVMTKKSPNIDRTNKSNEISRSLNKDNYTFKLVDNSIVYFDYNFSDNGELLKSSISYISGTYEEDEYDYFSENIPDDAYKLIENDNDMEELQDYLCLLYLKDKKIDNIIIENIQKLKRNMIVIRLDIDVPNSNDNHPEVHLTINNLKNSRYKVYKKTLVSGFLFFVLDIVYGMKKEKNNYICLNDINF